MEQGGEFESMCTTTDASTCHAASSHSKRAGWVKVLIKGCNTCQGCPGRACMFSAAVFSFCYSILFFIILYSLPASGVPAADAGGGAASAPGHRGRRLLGVLGRHALQKVCPA